MFFKNIRRLWHCWALRSAYVVSLSALAFVVQDFYHQQTSRNKEMKQVRHLSDQFVEFLTRLDQFADAAVKIETRYRRDYGFEKLPDRSALDSSSEFGQNATLDYSIMPDRSELGYYANLSIEEFTLFQRLYDDAGTHVRQFLFNNDEFKHLDQPLAAYDGILNAGEVERLRTKEQVYNIASRIRQIYDTQTHMHSLQIAYRLRELLHEHAQHQGSRLKFFLLLVLGTIVLTGLFVFLPIDITIQRLLRRLRLERNRAEQASREVAEAAEQIQLMAYLDSTTGLPNRSCLFALAQKFFRLNCEATTPSALMFLDLDGFKRVNDTMGHEAGDEILRMVSRRISHLIRTTDQLIRVPISDADSCDPDGMSVYGDVVARFGGDEFVCLLSSLHNEADAGQIAERIINIVRDPFCLETGTAQIGVSIGIAMVPAGCTDIEPYLKNADLAMYQAKRAGKNRWRFYHSGLEQPLVPRQAAIAVEPMEIDCLKPA